MAQITKAAFNTTYADSAGVFADNTTGLISEGDLRAFATDIKDSLAFNLDGAIKRISVTISSAQLLTLGTVPVQIIAAPGANKFLSINKIVASYNYGTTAYDYSAGESAYLYIGANWTGYQIAYTSMNAVADFNKQLNTSAVSEFTSLTNTALTLRTQAATDPSTGDGNLIVVVYYTIEDVNV